MNRRASALGAGWWVAGMESLCQCALGGVRMLWTGGDGSTRRYEPSGPGVWISQNPDAPADTVRHVGGTYYMRKVRGGGEIHFDGFGRHIRTVNRQGRITTFTWTNGRLTRIQVPVAGAGTAPAYDFVYDAGGILTHVHATTPTAATRTVTLGHELGGGRVTYIEDPDQHRVRFAYGNAARANLVTQRTDRRGTPLDFTFSPSGRLTGTRLPLAPGDTIITRFHPVEDRGMGTSAALSSTYTMLDGPRTDVQDRTYVWHTDRGAPRRIRDALGAETVVVRGDARFPALATEVVAPNGLRSTVVYDARGRVSESTVHGPLGDGRSTVTRYTYDDRWDAPTQVRGESVDGATVTPLGGVGYTTYDGSGNPLTQQQGEADTHLVQFRYYPAGHPHAGLLASVTGALDAELRRGRDSLVYDAAGNLFKTVSPSGFLTLHYRDGLGRDTLSITPIDEATATTETNLLAHGVRQRTTYDVMDQVRRTESIGPARTHAPSTDQVFTPEASPVQTLVVLTAYDEEVAPLQVDREGTPDNGSVGTLTTVYTYDPAGRKRTEVSSQSGTQRFAYDHAGNPTAVVTANQDTVRMQYDALGRLSRRMVPENTYSRACSEAALLLTEACEPFPRFPNFGTGYRVAEEWSHYRYDAAGDQVYAENGDARVQRTHFPNGALQTDSTWIRGATDLTYSAFGLRYTYDMAGRVTALEHPRNLTGSSVRPDSFYYHPVTGSMTRATSRLAHRFDFHNAANGQLTSLRQPGAVTDSMRYDVEGRLVWRHESGPSAGVLHDETMQYDARGKLVRATNGDREFRNWYTGLGTLAANDWRNLTENVARITEEFRTDALGNVTWRRTSRGAGSANPAGWPQYENVYQENAGRLLFAHTLVPIFVDNNWAQDSTARRYDPAGNMIRGFQRVGGTGGSGTTEIRQEVDTRSYYGADDRLRVLQRYDFRRTEELNHEDAGVWEEYRYDPLGRRILVRTRGDGGMCNIDLRSFTTVKTLRPGGI